MAVRAVGAVGSVRSRRDSAEGATTVHRNRRVVRCLQQALPKAEGRRPKAAKGDEGRRRATKGVLVRFRSSSCLRSAAVLPLLCHISATFLPLCPPRFRRYSTVIPPLSPHSAGVCHCSASIQPNSVLFCRSSAAIPPSSAAVQACSTLFCRFSTRFCHSSTQFTHRSAAGPPNSATGPPYSFGFQPSSTAVQPDSAAQCHIVRPCRRRCVRGRERENAQRT